jgi:Chaperone of endosialidase
MAVPYTFGSATTSIPLSQLDSNFATTITLGNTAIQLGNTVTTLNNMTLANVTISSGTSNINVASIVSGNSNVTITTSGGNIAMATNGATAVTINTSQNVGIGTTNPDFGSFGAGERILGVSNPTSGTRARLSLQNLSTSTSGVAGTIAFFNGSTQLASLDVTADGATNKGYYAFNTNNGSSNSERMRIDSSGNLLVGQTATILTGTIQFTFDGQNQQGMCIKNSANSSNGAAIRFIDYTNASTGGGIYFSSSNSITYATSSDYRLKQNIAPMVGALTKIQQLKPVTFNWKQDNSESQGFIAHELQAVIPQAVIGEKDAVDLEGNPRYQGVDTSYIVATLTAAIQELKAINDTQAETINALTARVVALESK